jgi:lipopolysaccharide export system protein LptC
MAAPVSGLHTRVVSILKVGLPLVALGLLAALFLVQPDDRIGGVVFSRGDVAALGSGLKVTNPIFTGTTEGNDRFRFTAAVIVPDAAPPKRAAITDLAGTLDLHEGPQVSLKASTGDLDIPTERLDLSGAVVITTSDGYRLESDRATLDLNAGTMIASDDVVGTGPLGRITSGTLMVSPASETGEERRFSFGDGVRLVYQPPVEERGAP